MLRDGGLQAVVIGTPMPFHVAQAVQALDAGVHVLCEVTAGVSVAECKELVLAASHSGAVYMLAENLNYDRSCIAVNGLVDGGRLGKVYYAEGEYLHNVRGLAETTPWRRHWQMGIRGLTYCTHALGPIMRWFKGDRVVRVCCEDGGSHYLDADGEPFAGDSAVMLAKTEQGRLIKIRVDLTSNRPYGADKTPPRPFRPWTFPQCLRADLPCTVPAQLLFLRGAEGPQRRARTALAGMNFELQGTHGAVEISNSSGAGGWGQGRLAIDGSGEGHEEWQDLAPWMATADADAVLPPEHRQGSAEFEQATRSGHNGSDFYVTATFLAACRGEAKEAVGIHEAMDMTLPGLVSQDSAAADGAWLEVPNSRDWVATTSAPKL